MVDCSAQAGNKSSDRVWSRVEDQLPGPGRGQPLQAAFWGPLWDGHGVVPIILNILGTMAGRWPRPLLYKFRATKLQFCCWWLMCFALLSILCIHFCSPPKNLILHALKKNDLLLRDTNLLVNNLVELSSVLPSDIFKPRNEINPIYFSP